MSSSTYAHWLPLLYSRAPLIGGEMTAEFRVLGAVELLVDGEDRAPSAPKVRQVLALLLARANRVVTAASIISEVWDGHPPASASTTTQTYIYQLRKLLTANGIGGEDTLRTRGNGYCLSIEPMALDEHNFRELVRRAQDMLHNLGFVKPAARCVRRCTPGRESHT